MDTPQSLPWAEPLDIAASLDAAGGDFVLLYSGLRAGYSGRYSLLACTPRESVTGESLATLAPKLTQDKPQWQNAWFGYLGYGLKNALEELPADTPGWLALPALHMTRFATVLVFDHETRTLAAHGEAFIPPAPGGAAAAPAPAVARITSNMGAGTYRQHVAAIVARIHAGQLYQANLTRKFMGEFESRPAPFGLFRQLCAISPAAYSSFLKLGDTCILSSSPELFLRIGAGGAITARPIKGTSPRRPDPVQDEASRRQLAESAKDRAENLMIVDLMRNDLARASIPGSVKTRQLFEITSHSAVHHMSSTVTAQRRPGSTTLDVIGAAFPPGSMTGAPKIMAMRLCSQLEQLERGVYSGAIGWLGGDGSAELSVVIRTLLIRGNRFEFQVGGGVVADSTPQGELQETIDKASGILKLLGLSPDIFVAMQ